MFRPRFEDPIDSAQDAVDRNITIFTHQFFYPSSKVDMLSINSSDWTHIAETMVPVNWDEYENYTRDFIHGNGTHAFIRSYLSSGDLAIAPAEKWWRSSEKIPGDYPWGGYLSAKNWMLNEVRIIHKYLIIDSFDYFPRNLLFIF